MMQTRVDSPALQSWPRAHSAHTCDQPGSTQYSQGARPRHKSYGVIDDYIVCRALRLAPASALVHHTWRGMSGQHTPSPWQKAPRCCNCWCSASRRLLRCCSMMQTRVGSLALQSWPRAHSAHTSCLPRQHAFRPSETCAPSQL
jgi:hypothetical protein